MSITVPITKIRGPVGAPPALPPHVPMTPYRHDCAFIVFDDALPFEYIADIVSVDDNHRVLTLTQYDGTVFHIAFAALDGPMTASMYLVPDAGMTPAQAQAMFVAGQAALEALIADGTITRRNWPFKIEAWDWQQSGTPAIKISRGEPVGVDMTMQGTEVLDTPIPTDPLAPAHRLIEGSLWDGPTEAPDGQAVIPIRWGFSRGVVAAAGTNEHEYIELVPYVAGGTGPAE